MQNADFLLRHHRRKRVADEVGGTTQGQPRLASSRVFLPAVLLLHGSQVHVKTFLSVVQRDAPRGEVALEGDPVQPGERGGLRQGLAVLRKESHRQDQPGLLRGQLVQMSSLGKIIFESEGHGRKQCAANRAGRQARKRRGQPRRDLLVFAARTWQDKSVRTSTRKDRRPTDDQDDDFCLADTLVNASDEELERMAETDAQNEVTSSAYEGIPLDKAALKAGLLAAYKQVRAERAARRQTVPTRLP